MPHFHFDESLYDFDVAYEVVKTLVSSLNAEGTLDRSLRYLSYALGWRSAFIAVAEPDGHLGGLCRWMPCRQHTRVHCATRTLSNMFTKHCKVGLHRPAVASRFPRLAEKRRPRHEVEKIPLQASV
ncbi:hypothetical protein OKW43_006352 [Paraburkholderia sp. WC7.3g]|uniref:hypothetical protein n=1 Tax=Paraburkholderia sp. WC7.3g TaxID=2991070 RepID=UPI003D2336B6